jgi:ABC-2 type transport system ATP-binding protein
VRSRGSTSTHHSSRPPDGLAIDAREVRKNYGGPPGGAGLNGLDLAVVPGTVHGLLGPNGAGKTTAIRILTTLLRMDSGAATVAGHDVTSNGRAVRKQVGLVGQSAAVDEVLTGRQNLLLAGRLNHLPTAAALRRADELLDHFALTDAALRKVSTYSGGMRRRLDLAAALVVTPAVLFVDEPTTGLDPQGRREVWTAVRDLVSNGTTVLLTTQYLEEADQLADRISMLRDGVVVTTGTPAELKASIGGDRLEITVAQPSDFDRLRGLAAPFAAGDMHVDTGTLTVTIPVTDRTRALVGLSTALTEGAVEPTDITVRRPSLDEVFLHMMAGRPAVAPTTPAVTA